MSRLAVPPISGAETAGPALDLAELISRQGFITEAEYLSYHGNQLVEFADGCIEVLPTPTTSHQMIVLFLLDAFRAFLLPRNLGKALFAPLRVRLRNGTFREPDLVQMLAEHADRIGEGFWDGADLVVEVVSPGNRRHDLEVKRRDYAEAGIPEYWLVDPQERVVLVLTLRDGQYHEHGRFVPGQTATSSLLPGLQVDVATTFAARP